MFSIIINNNLILKNKENKKTVDVFYLLFLK